MDRSILRSAFATYGLAWLWVAFVSMVLTVSFGPESSLAVSPALDLTWQALDILPSLKAHVAQRPAAMLVMVLVFAPLFEEAVFRLLPLSFALVVGSLIRDRRDEPHARQFIDATLVVVCGLIFGILHGGPVNILVQGAVGLCLGRLYLRHSLSQKHAYVVCVAVHAAYNFTTIAASLMG